MDINLNRVLSFSKDSPKSRSQMRSIMQDLYPEKIREMNNLLDVFESGIPREMKNMGMIDDMQYTRYINKIVADYGLQQIYAIEAINAWIDVCLQSAMSAKLKLVYGQQVPEHSIVNPIKHNSQGNNNVPVVVGNNRDYEVRNIDSTTISIFKFIGFDVRDTVVPNEINGKKVVEIGDDAYKSCAGIVTLIIPEGIKKIGRNAFRSCSSLKEVTFPTTLMEIGSFAFSSTAVEKIELPNDIEEISCSAFSFCRNLTSVILPDNLKVIGAYAFQFCSKLVSIHFPRGVINGEYSAFEQCSLLSNVVLNEGLKKIGKEVFKGCTALKSIIIPSTTVEFGEAIFCNIYSFDRLNIEIGCYPGSRAIEYARNNHMKIVNANNL